MRRIVWLSVCVALIFAVSVAARDIAAGTITADRLNVSTLSAISANLGTVTAGAMSSVTMSAVTIESSTMQAGSGDEVTLDNNGITLTGGATSRSRVKWNDGSYVGVTTSGVLDVVGGDVIVLTVGGNSISFNESGQYFAPSSGVDIGTSGGAWDELWITPDTTSDALHPLVISGNQVLEKTDGANSSGCTMVDVEYGIVTNCSFAPTPEVVALKQQVADLKAELTALQQAVQHLLASQQR